MTYLYLMAKLLEIFSKINSGLDQENNFFFKLHIFLLLNADNVLQTIPFCFVFYSKICGKKLNSQRVTKLKISKDFYYKNIFFKSTCKEVDCVLTLCIKKYFLRMLLQGFKKYDDARLMNAFFFKLLNVAKYQMVTANAIR